MRQSISAQFLGRCPWRKRYLGFNRNSSDGTIGGWPDLIVEAGFEEPTLIHDIQDLERTAVAVWMG